MKAPLTSCLIACSLASSVQGFQSAATSIASYSSLAATLLKNQEEIDEVNNHNNRKTPRSYLESLSQANTNSDNTEPLQTSLDPWKPTSTATATTTTTSTEYSSSDLDLRNFDLEAYRQQVRDETATTLLQLQQEKQQAVQRLQSALQTTLFSMQQQQATRTQLAELKVQVQSKEIELLQSQLDKMKNQMVTDLQLTTQAKLAQQAELQRLRETEKLKMLQQLQEQLNAKLMERQALMVEKEALMSELQQEEEGESKVNGAAAAAAPVNGEAINGAQVNGAVPAVSVEE